MSRDVAESYDSISQEYDERLQPGDREDIQNAIIFDILYTRRSRTAELAHKSWRNAEP
jgi:hypothetical protein